MADIAFIAPREEMLRQARQVAAEMGLEPDMYLVTTEGAIECARQAVQKGANILIARGYQATLIRRHISAVVIEVVMTGQEMGLLVSRGKAMLQKERPVIGVVGYDNMFSDMSLFDEIYDVRLKKYFAGRGGDALESLQEQAKRAVDDRVDLIIGGDIALSWAARGGIASLFLSSTVDSIRESFRIARRAAYAGERERENTTQLRTVFDALPSALIRLDGKGNVEFFNAAAGKIFGWEEYYAVGKNICHLVGGLDPYLLNKALDGEEVYCRINGRKGIMLSSSFVPIRAGGVLTGVLLSCHPLQRLQNWITQTQPAREAGTAVIYHFGQFDEPSAAMHTVYERSRKAAENSAPVWIFCRAGGEGERLAQSIHAFSSRAARAYVSIDCAALKEEEQESALLGGTGKRSALLRAHKGTLCLHAPQKLTQHCQRKLLQALEHHGMESSEGAWIRSIDVKIIVCAPETIAFEKDASLDTQLAHFLSAWMIRVPPLSQRPEDIAYWVQYFLERYGKQCGRLFSISQAAVRYLQNAPWPGELLELGTFCKNLVFTCEHKNISEEMVRMVLWERKKNLQGYLDEGFQTGEEKKLLDVLANCPSRAEAAKELGISTTTLWRRMKKMGIKYP